MATKTRWCEICMAEIPADRIETAPGTRLCTEHANMIEEYGGEFITVATQESLGKQDSFKKKTMEA
jgi:RNA polymerase-binding transcription factor DksA